MFIKFVNFFTMRFIQTFYFTFLKFEFKIKLFNSIILITIAVAFKNNKIVNKDRYKNI